MWQFLIPILGEVVRNVTPAVRTKLEVLLDELEAYTKTTANPVDDILVSSLKAIMLGKDA